MTSTVSNNTMINPLLHNYRCGVKSKTKIATLLLALHLTAAPMVVISLIADIYNRGMSGDMLSMFVVMGAATTGIAGVIGIFIAIDAFNCLNTKSFVDMKLSLPMTASGRFLSNFFAGFTAYVAPFLAAQVISVLGMLYGLIFMDGRTFETVSGYDSSGSPLFTPYVCEYFGEFFPALLKLILCGVLVMLMMYTLAVFVAVCCGNKFESIAYTVLMNILIPTAIFYIISAMFDGLFGIEIYQELINIVTFTSPVGGAIGALDRCFEDTVNAGFLFGYNNETISGLGMWAAVYFLITAALFGVSFLLYKKRRADHVSKPFAFKFLYHIISFVTVLLIYSLFYLDDHKATLPAIVTTLIVYIVMEFAANRGFKKVWLSGIKYVCTIGFSILLLFTAQKTEGFGAVEKVPDISKVRSVTLQDYGGFYGMFESSSSYTDGNGDRHAGNLLVFKEQENIQTIIDAHQSFVDNRKEDKKYINSGIKIIYTLKSGRTLERFYNGIWAEEAEILSKIDLSDEFKTQVAEKNKWYILNAKESWESRLNSTDYTEYANYIYLYENFYRFTEKYDVNNNLTPLVPLLKRGFFDQLAEAYCADIMDITEENYYMSDNVNMYISFYGGPNTFIPESFTRTLKVYENFGFKITDRKDISDTETDRTNLQNMANDHEIRIFTAAEWREANCVPDGVRLHGSYNSQYSPRDYYGLDYDNYIYDIGDSFMELYCNMQPMNIVPDDGYIIYVSGNTAAVPKELNGIAKEVAAERQPIRRTDQGTVEVPIQYYD